MLFSELLGTHRSAKSTNSHPDILGDAFLMTENPTYRQIKLQAMDLGVSLTEATTQYLLMPFHHLDLIVSSKKVPFIPTARLMDQVESKHPGIFNLEKMSMPESYHLHESAHIIGEHCCADINIDNPEEKILKFLLCESFANAVDALACAHAESELHQTFIKLNCYMAPEQINRNQLKRIRETLGEKFTIRLILLSYVFANFLHDEVPLALIENWITQFSPRNTKPTKKLLSDCVGLSHIGQRLDPLFRLRTTENYFRLQGFQSEIYDLLNFDFVGLLERQDFNEALESMLSRLSQKDGLK